MNESGEDQEIKEDASDQVLRLRADFENTKKRLERDKLEAIRFANEKFLAEVLPVVDNFDRAMASLSEGHEPEKVKVGLEIAQDELHRILERHGIQKVKSVGTMFDPKFHEAVAVSNEPGVKEGMVVEEIEKGYLLNGRLIRPSRVRIAQNTEGEEQRTEDSERETDDREQKADDRE